MAWSSVKTAQGQLYILLLDKIKFVEITKLNKYRDTELENLGRSPLFAAA
jgi:hypothetical protein